MAELTPRQEAELAAAVLDAYGVWLPDVNIAVNAGYIRFGVAPDPAAIARTVPEWRQQIMLLEAQHLRPIAEEAYAEEDPTGQLTASEAIMAAAAAATLLFLLAQVGEIESQLTTIVATAASVPAAVVAVRDFLNPGNSHWSMKAKQVAVTEGGRWAQAATLQAAVNAQRRDGIRRIKEWVSRDDELVRPTHVLADGQTRPLLVPFNVGGSPMMYPKAPEGPPQEVVRCRCGLRIRREG